ncbi:MAG: hypothetical protein HY695_17150 [Deltaproteobacteria bacterium]|nr:hypothetical protein [Deltaproteobacteria bacterium]
MKGQAIPDPDHVGRYCKASTVENGEISAAAFMIRETEEYLSVNWLEELKHPDRASQIRDLQNLYAMKFNRVGATARIAILNVGMLRSKVASESPDGRLLRVLHEPLEPGDPSHAGIYELFHDDEIIAELIAQVVVEKHSARA